MINNATNINKASNHLSPENNWTHKVHDIWHRHQGPGFGQAQKYRRVKPVDRISALPPLDNWISKGRIDISTQRKTFTDLLHLKKTTFYHKNE